MTSGWYTFGNHFHWVDMQWMWGNGVLARSIDDMLSFIDRTGAPGNLNFDGVGYEKLAAEEPAALSQLVAALEDGRVEVVGGTYGQPYAQFHHGESAVRQLSYGVRTAMRVLGVRPRAFWEEEFCFFPQLPQLLRDAGYTGASLFFQWTWHTPELPRETAPAIRWRGLDGTEVLALPRSELNLHQWPEDVEALIADGGIDRYLTPVVQQWLELLPSPEWMCRSEIVAPGVERLLGSSGVDFQLGTLSTVLAGVADLAEPREYSLDEVFHGMSLGKNGNRVHRVSRELEHTLLAAESAAVHAGLAGRPYAQWGKYPSWELEEAWRELLAFQHHDNDECEGLCGHVGYLGAKRGLGLARHVRQRNLEHIAARTVPAGDRAVVNPLGWPRRAVVGDLRLEVPAFGACDLTGAVSLPPVEIEEREGIIRMSRGGFAVTIDPERGVATSVGGVDAGVHGLGGLRWRRGGEPEEFSIESVAVEDESVRVTRSVDGASVRVDFRFAGELDALDVRIRGDLGAGPDGRAHAALMTLIEPGMEVTDVRHDSPYAVTAIEGRSRWHRKYPTGDWMASAQEFEEIVDAFSALQFVDLLRGDGAGLLCIHDGSQGFHRATTGVWNVLSMRDPWDEHYYLGDLDARLRFVPHDPQSDTWRWKAAQEFTRPAVTVVAPSAGPHAVAAPIEGFGTFVDLEGDPSVVLTALYQESDFQTAELADRVPARGAVYARLVEFDGVPASVRVRFTPAIRRAWRCTALGEVIEPLPIVDGAVTLHLAHHAIATIAVDPAPAPGDDKTLDGDRGIWATVHREADQENRPA